MVDNQRVAYGKALVELGETNPNVIVLEADLGKSTMGFLFEEQYPDRFYEMGIAEANMASVAAGFSLTGKIPFIASFAVFCPGRCYDQIRTSICIPALNVKICGSSAGLSDFGDGSTHQSVDDLALMRVLPNMQVYCPADAAETARIIRYMAETPGPMYLRLNRNPLPHVTTDALFVPGNVSSLREGEDVAIFATGVMVSQALEAAELLQQQGISASVVNVPSIKPLNAHQVREISRSVRAVVTAEEHSIYGGLGDAIAQANEGLGIKQMRVGIADVFGTSGQNYQILLEQYGLTPQAIANATKAVL